MDTEHQSVQLATLTEQISGLKSRFEVVEKKIDSLVNLGTTIAELNAHREHEARERQVMWDRLHEIANWKPEQERKGSEDQHRLVTTIESNSKIFAESCHTIEKKVDSWINKFKGAFWVLGILWLLFQSLGAWYFISTTSQLGDLHSRMNKVETQQLVELEIRKRGLNTRSHWDAR